MTQLAKTSLTMGGLCLLLVVGGLWAWQAATAPLPELEPPPPCVETEVAKGDRVGTEEVVLSVFNGSKRQGLAGETMNTLERRGFVRGDVANAELKDSENTVEIWTDEPKDPAVRLVRRQFRKPAVVEGKALGPGVVIVIGDDYTELAKARDSVKVREDTTFCSATGAGTGGV